MIFTTTRLCIRPLQEEDLPGYAKMHGNPNVMQYVGGKTMTLEENRKDLKQVIDLYQKPDNTFWVWAIENPEDEFVGTCAIIINSKDQWEIGYRFLEDHWGKGFGTEITQGLIEHAFQSMKIQKLHAYVDRENKGSVKILDRFFNFVDEYWCEDEQCWDRSYVLENPHE